MNHREQIEDTIAKLEAQRAVLGNEATEIALGPLRAQLRVLMAQTEKRRLLTVLFADVSGFVALTDAMDAEDIHHLTNELWHDVDSILLAHGAKIDKHMGDAVMALWGSESTREDDAEQAIRAALAIQEAVQTFRTKRSIALGLRIGINTGPAMLGHVGTQGEFTALGDAVNLASRIERAAPVGSILIAHAAYQHVRGIFDMQVQPPLYVKGKTEPLHVYLVHGSKRRAGRLRGIDDITTPMFGRELELDALRTALERARNLRQLQCVTLVGEAGIGKSRLREEFQLWLRADQPQAPLILNTQLTQQNSQLPYGLLRNLFYSWCDILDTDTLNQARAKLIQRISELVDDTDAVRATVIGHLIGLDFADSPHIKDVLNDARQLRDRAFFYINQLLEAIAQSVPAAVIFVEDLHWADAGSLAYLDYLVEHSQELPILLLYFTRPSLFEQRPDWGQAQPFHRVITLKALDDATSQQLVDQLLQRLETPEPTFRELIIRRAEGNPFYIEELIKMFIDHGVIDIHTGKWIVNLAALDEKQVPTTLTGVLQARADRLNEAERDTLQRAAVVGRNFWDEVVEQLRDTDQVVEDIEPIWDDLQIRELILLCEESAFSGIREFMFKHNLQRDVMYETVMLKRRRVYHRQVAEWLIARSQDRVNSYAAVIADHFHLAQADQDAAIWYGRAAKQAQITYAANAAIDYYQRALDLLADDADAYVLRAEWYDGLGETLRVQGQLDQAETIFEKLRTISQDAGDGVTEALAWIRLAIVQQRRADIAGMAVNTREAEKLARSAGDAGQLQLASATYIKAWIAYYTGNLNEAIALGAEALALSRALDDKAREGESLNLLGAAHNKAGNFEQSLHYRHEALALYRQIRNRRGIAAMLNGLGSTANEQHDFRAGVQYFDEAHRIFIEVGDTYGEIIAQVNLGNAYLYLEDYAAAETNLIQTLKLQENFPNKALLSPAYINLSETYLGQERYTEAADAAQQGLALSQAQGNVVYSGSAWRALGRVAGALGEAVVINEQPYDFRACFQESLAIFENIKADSERALTLREFARCELAAGARERSISLWNEARAIYTTLDMKLALDSMTDVPPGF